MKKLAIQSLWAKPVSRSTLLAIVCAAVGGTSGCGIPCYRGAFPGPALPVVYHMNNGHLPVTQPQPVPIDAPAPTDGDDEAAEQVTSDANPFRNIKLVNFSEQSETVSDSEAPDLQASRNVQSVPGVDADDVEMASEEANDQFVVPPLPSDESGITFLPNSAQVSKTAFFQDPLLLDLINQALVGNQELRILAEQIQIECNETYARSGEYRPFVTYGASTGLEKSSRFSRDGAVEEGLEVAPGKAFPEPLPDFIVAANISWELDIWKRLRNAQNSAYMRYLASTEGRNYVVTRLAAEIAENYYELLALDNRMMTLQKTIEIQQSSLEISVRKKEAGRGTELAVQRFQAEVQKNQSELLLIEQEIVEVENRINYLVGRYPQPVDRVSVAFLDMNFAALSAGLPAELLRNRADIREAEREVAAAGLDVEVARARFYPSFGLSAGVGLNAHTLQYLFKSPDSLIYSVAADLAGPLINKRAIQAEYKTANARQLQAIYEYQRTVLIAHIEVVNYMTKVENYGESIEAKKEQLRSLEKSVEVANQLFQNARAEYVEVLLAQRELMEARMLIIDTKQEQLGAVVNAYQALGGGAF